MVLNWTDPEGDFGSLFPIAPPYRVAPDLTAALTAPVVNYNDLPLMFSAALGNDETPTGAGASKTWAWVPSALTPDDFDLHTYQFGDDVLTDWFQLSDGILTELSFTGPETGGPVTSSMNWLFAEVRSTGSTDSPGRRHGADRRPVGRDQRHPGLRQGHEPVHRLHRRRHRWHPDHRRAAQLRPDHHGRHRPEALRQRHPVASPSRSTAAPRMLVELACTFAKTADTVGTGCESDAWMSDDAVNRYVRLSAESTAEASAAVPYSWVMDLPLRYYTREEGEMDGNTTIVLTGRTFLDDTLDHAFSTTVVNTLAARQPRVMSTDPVAVGVGACQCPGTPHPDGDVVYLRPQLGLAAGIAIQRLIVEANQDAGRCAPS